MQGICSWSASFDQLIAQALSGLAFLHEYVNVAHETKPAKLSLVAEGAAQMTKVDDPCLRSELVTNKSFGTTGYSATEVYYTERFYGDPVNSSYAILGKSDPLGPILVLLFVTEGRLPHATFLAFCRAFEQHCDGARGLQRGVVLRSLRAVATKFYSQFSPKLPTSSQHTLSHLSGTALCHARV